MSHMPSLPNHERRITTLETRVGEIERHHGESLYTIKKMLTKHHLWFRSIGERLDAREPTEEDIVEALDQE